MSGNQDERDQAIFEARAREEKALADAAGWDPRKARRAHVQRDIATHIYQAVEAAPMGFVANGGTTAFLLAELALRLAQEFYQEYGFDNAPVTTHNERAAGAAYREGFRDGVKEMTVDRGQ